MKNQELYERSVNILLDAYNSDDLEHGSCYACAVGNLVRSNGGFRGACSDGDPMPAWDNVFITPADSQQVFHADEYFGVAKEEIDQTGYSKEELARIEFAFESSICRTKEGRDYYVDPFKYIPMNRRKKGQFIGLCAVLDVLREIHEVDKDSHEASQTRLEKIYHELTA